MRVVKAASGSEEATAGSGNNPVKSFPSLYFQSVLQPVLFPLLRFPRIMSHKLL